jgi:alpha-N-arabinofuranosidase
MFKKYIFSIAILAGCFISATGFAQKIQPIVIKADKPIADIQPTMWGIFFEDINAAADGGIYAELVKNRSFEFFSPFMGWKIQKQDSAAGSILVINRGDLKVSNPRFVRVTADNSKGTYGLTNYGFKGMGIKQNLHYHFSILAAQGLGSNLKLRVELTDTNGNVIGTSLVAPEGTEWKKYEADFIASATEPKAKLTVWFEGKGTIDVDMISLFPGDTWKNRSNGLRADLVQLLADLKPGFLRFPGGCIVEGRDLASRYQWKKTIGNVEDRQLIVNRWNTEFNHRPSPDYFQSFGLGFYEYFQLAEDIGASPLPILSCGMACQFNTGEVVPLDQLDPYVQDALDLIEFANGSSDSRWGKIRTQMGHPASFHLKLLGVGNEQWGPQYIERYKVLVNAIHDKYPDIKIVSGTGPFPEGEYFDFAAKELKKLNAQIVDEHYYRNPQWFRENATRYDGYDRNSFKIFAGEYAAQTVAIASPDNKNTLECALSEAAFMTGMERNADVVYMTSYAPLLAHTEGWQWTPDLIWFDNLTSFGTPDYYVQKLFSTNRGDKVLSMLLDNKPLTGQEGIFGSSTLELAGKELIIKLVNTSDKSQAQSISVESTRKLSPKGKLTVLKGNDLNGMNSLVSPQHISPVEQELVVKGRKISVVLSPYSMNVIRVKLM